jgi:hypothetical protein
VTTSTTEEFHLNRSSLVARDRYAVFTDPVLWEDSFLDQSQTKQARVMQCTREMFASRDFCTSSSHTSSLLTMQGLLSSTKVETVPSNLCAGIPI